MTRGIGKLHERVPESVDLVHVPMSASALPDLERWLVLADQSRDAECMSESGRGQRAEGRGQQAG